MKSVAPYIHQDLCLGILTYNSSQISLYNISQTPSKVSIPFNSSSSSSLKEISIPLIEVMSLNQFLVSHSIKGFLTTLDSILDVELDSNNDKESSDQSFEQENSEKFTLTSTLLAIKDWFLGKGSIELMETGTSVVSSSNNPDYFSNSNSIQSTILGDMTKTNNDSYDLSKIWMVLKSVINSKEEEEININTNINNPPSSGLNNKNQSTFSSFSSIQLYIISDTIEPLFNNLNDEKLDRSSQSNGGGCNSLYSLKQNFIHLNIIPHLFILHNNNKLPIYYSPISSSTSGSSPFSFSSSSLFPHSLSSFINSLGGNIWTNNLMDDYSKNLNYVIELFIQFFDFSNLYTKCSLMLRSSENINLNNTGIINNKFLPYHSSSPNSNLKQVPVSWFAPGLNHSQYDSIWQIPRLTKSSSLGFEPHISNTNNAGSSSEKFIQLNDRHIDNYLLNIKESIRKIFHDNEKEHEKERDNEGKEKDSDLEYNILKELSSYLPGKLSLINLSQSRIEASSYYLNSQPIILPLLYATFQLTLTYEQVIDMLDDNVDNYYDVDQDSDEEDKEILDSTNIKKFFSKKSKISIEKLKKKRQLNNLKNSIENCQHFLPFLTKKKKNFPLNLDQKLNDFIELELSDKNSKLYNENTLECSLNPETTSLDPSSTSPLPPSRYNYNFHPSSKLYTVKKLRVITFRIPLSNNLSNIISSSSSTIISQLIIRKSLHLSQGMLGLPVLNASIPTNTSSSSSSSSTDFNLPQFNEEMNESSSSFSQNFSRFKILSKLFTKSFSIPSLSRLYKTSSTSSFSTLSKGDLLLLISNNGIQGEIVVIEALLTILLKRVDIIYQEFQLQEEEKEKEREKEKIKEREKVKNASPLIRTDSGLLDGVYYVDIEAPYVPPSNSSNITEKEEQKIEKDDKEEEKKRKKDKKIEEKLKIITKIFSLKSIKNIINFCFNYLVKLSHTYSPSTITFSSNISSTYDLILKNYPSSTVYNLMNLFNSISTATSPYFTRLLIPSFYFFHYKSGYISSNFVNFFNIKNNLNYLIKDTLLICDNGKEINLYIPSDIVWKEKLISHDEIQKEGEENEISLNENEEIIKNKEKMKEFSQHFNDNSGIKTYLKSSINYSNIEKNVEDNKIEEKNEDNNKINENINLLYNSNNLDSEINLYEDEENEIEKEIEGEVDDDEKIEEKEIKLSLNEFKSLTSFNNNNNLIQFLKFYFRVIKSSQELFNVTLFNLSQYSSSNSSLFTQYLNENNKIFINSYINNKELLENYKEKMKKRDIEHKSSGIGRVSNYEEDGEGLSQDYNINDLSLTDFSEALAEIIIAIMED